MRMKTGRPKGYPAHNKGVKCSLYERARRRARALIKKGYEPVEAIKKACNEYGVEYGIYVLSYVDAIK